MNVTRVEKWLALVVVLVALAIAGGCEMLEAQKKRLAGDPLIKGGKDRANAAGSAKERARAAIDSISADDERALGEAVALRIVATTLAKTVPTADGTGTRPSTGLLLNDAALVAYVNHVGNLVALQGKRDPPPVPEVKPGQPTPTPRPPRTKARRFTFAVLDTTEVGAYSTPGGYIFITRGLLGKLTSESELAWVLAHEISHVDAEDGLTALKADLATKSTFAALDEALTGTKRENPDPMQDPKFFGAIADRFYEIYEGTGLGRNDEFRADLRGLEYSTAAGYDGQGAARALEALEPAGTGAPIGAALSTSFNRFVTHGSKKGRLDAMQSLLTKEGKTGAGRYDRNALARVEQIAAVKP